MTYPINADEYIAEAKRHRTVTDRYERFYREEMIPMVNSFYQEGRTDPEPWALDVAECIAWIEQKRGRPLSERGRQAIAVMIERCNHAYAQGQQDAREGRS